MSTPDSSANNTQLVRYQLTIPTMVGPSTLAEMRGLLQQHNLLVDRLAPGEAVVASATGTELDWPSIKDSLAAAGYPITHTTTLEEG